MITLTTRASAVSRTAATALLSLALQLMPAHQAAAQAAPAAEPPFRRHFVGSSLFMAFNLAPDPPSFFQLNYGYRASSKTTLSVEAITWRYTAPLGIPWGPAYGKKEEEYQGSVRGGGVGVAAQRFIWRGAYVGAHALPLLQRYSDATGKHLQNGFQLFTTVRAGYQVKLLGDRWFIEPSVAATAWPINTNVPASFAALDRKWNSYFLFEPGLHFGRRF